MLSAIVDEPKTSKRITMKIKVPVWLIKFFSKIYLFPTPFFIIYNPHVHKVKGHECRQMCNKIKAGDILLRRFDGYLSSRSVPGFWSHAGLYIGKHRVIHAIGEGVVNEDILDFMRTDHAVILRFKESNKDRTQQAIQLALNMVKDNIEYDYKFEDDNGMVYCTELINEVFDNKFRHEFNDIAGNNVINPDDIYTCDLLDNIIEFRH